MKRLATLLLSLVLCASLVEASYVQKSGVGAGTGSYIQKFASAPPAWTPASKSGLIYWFRSTDNVTKDGSNLVSTWGDLSSNGYDATATGAHTPTWTANQSPNGKECIYFDGASGSVNQDFMSFAAGVNLAQEGSPRSYFFTVRVDPKAGPGWFSTLLSNRTPTTDSNFSLLFSDDSVTYGLTFWGIYKVTSTTSVKSTFDFTTGGLVYNARMTYNGGAPTSSGSWSLAAAGVNQTLANSVGTGMQSGNTNTIGEWNPIGSSLSLKGCLFELGAYDSLYTGTEPTDMNTYQTGYWGN